ncbi:hypothetical protein [Halomonas sp. RT37]|uniref:Bacteriophage tail tape measure C-terminal domain-containing protein n=1 Tax=Halomonas sp. RT37 TaxID=2950872 RepID=A0AAU7KCY6_9GAMM
MAVRSLGQLTLDLVARVGGFTGPMDQASRAAKKDMADIAKSFKGAATAITATAGTVAAAGGAIVALTKTAADNARTLQNQAQVANASVEEFQRMAYATQSVQIEQDKLSQILQDVNDRVGDFMQSGGGEMADFFENIAPQVGVTADQFRNLSGPQALQLYYDSLERANLSQQDMTFYLEAIASDTTALIPLLRDGGQGFADMAAEADELGIVLSELDIAKLNEFGRQFDRVNGILATTGQLIAAELSPYLSTIGDDLVELAADGDGFGESVRNAVESSLEVIGYLSNALHGIEVVMKGMRAAAFSVGQAYTAVFAEITNAATFLMDQVAGAINTVIDGINHIPGVDDIPLISSFQDSSYAQGIRALRDEMAGLGEDARQEFVEAFNEPLPKTVIDEWLREVRNSTDELASDIALPGMTVTGSSLPNAKDREAALKAQAAAQKEVSDAARELADSQQQLLDRLYPAKATWAQYREDLELLNLREKTDETLDLADAQQRLANELSVGLTGGFMEQLAGGGAMEDGEDDGYWEKWLEGAQEAFTNFDELAGDTIDNFSSRFGDAFESMIFDAESLGDAVYGIADGMARSIVNALGEMAAEWLAYQAVQMLVGRTTQASAATTQAANAQAMSQMAGLNAYSSTAAIPIVGPVLAPGAMAAAIAATQPVAASVAAMSVAGMAHDGIDSVPQDGTWLLQKGERVTTADTSAKLDRTLDDVQRNRSGGDVSVNVVNNGQPMQATASTRMEDGKMVIDVLLQDLNKDGRYIKALRGQTNVQRRGN